MSESEVALPSIGEMPELILKPVRDEDAGRTSSVALGSASKDCLVKCYFNPENIADSKTRIKNCIEVAEFAKGLHDKKFGGGK